MSCHRETLVQLFTDFDVEREGLIIMANGDWSPVRPLKDAEISAVLSDTAASEFSDDLVLFLRVEATERVHSHGKLYFPSPLLFIACATLVLLPYNISVSEVRAI